jgi:hypothetical protein
MHVGHSVEVTEAVRPAADLKLTSERIPRKAQGPNPAIGNLEPGLGRRQLGDAVVVELRPEKAQLAAIRWH